MTTPNYPQQAALWSMDPYSFNEWRANNDIPALFAKFATLLPGFQDWVKSLPFDQHVMMRIVPSGDLFKGTAAKVVIDRPGDALGQRVIECFPVDESEKRTGGRTDTKNIGTFYPYFLWAKQNLKSNRFFFVRHSE